MFESKTQKLGKIASALVALQAGRSEHGTQFISSDVAKKTLGLESFEGEHYENIKSDIENARGSVGTVVASLGLESADVELATESALGAAFLAEDSSVYRSTITNAGSKLAGIDLVSSGIGATRSIGTESFDKRDFKYKDESIVFNATALITDKATKALFHTHVLSPTEPGIIIESTNTFIQRPKTYDTSGAPVEHTEFNLTDGFYDHTIVLDDTIDFVPVVAADNKNKEFFVDAALYEPTKRVINDKQLLTAPINADKDVNLLALASAGDRFGGYELDHTDRLNNRILLDGLTFKITNTIGGEEKVSVVDVDTKSLPSALFTKSTVGDSETLQLNLTTKVFTVGKGTRDIANNEAVALAPLHDANVTLVLSVTATTTIDMRHTNVKRLLRDVSIVEAYDEKNEQVALDDTQINNLIADLKIEIIGYDIDADFTNSNRRQVGPHLTTRSTKAALVIEMGSPINHEQPIDEKGMGDVVKNITDISRMRTMANAVTTVETAFDQIKEYTKLDGIVGNSMLPSEVFVGSSDNMRPFAREYTVPVDHVKYRTSVEALENIRTGLVNKLQTALSEMITESRYNTLMASLGINAKPRVSILTSPRIANYVVIQGDNRLLGDAVDFNEIVSLDDKRLEDTIYVVFQHEDSSLEAIQASFGIRGWIPELVSEATITRNGRTTSEVEVRPRESFFITCPAIVKLTAAGLDKKLTNELAEKQ